MPVMENKPPPNHAHTVPAVSPSTELALHRAKTMLALTDGILGGNRSMVSDAWLDELIAWADATGISEESLPRDKQKILALTELWLGFNRLTTLPASLGNLTNLIYLDLRGNHLTTLPASLGNLTNLTALCLDGNQLTALPASLGNLTNLTLLGLGVNQLTTLPASLGNLTNLTWLSLGCNPLTTLPTFLGNLTNLESLSLSRDQHLPSALHHLKPIIRYYAEF